MKRRVASWLAAVDGGLVAVLDAGGEGRAITCLWCRVRAAAFDANLVDVQRAVWGHCEGTGPSA